MKRIQKVFIILASIAVILGMIFSMLPLPASAAELSVSGWIPYWKVKEGTREAKDNIDTLDVVHPFVYTVKSDGKLKDLGKLSGNDWKRLFSAARTNNVLVVPTVMTSNTDVIHDLLSDSKKRAKHVKAIADVVKKGKFDGIDIDYEGKKAATKDYYSAFLKELKSALGAKLLSCTIEARTPPEDLYRSVPADIRYANDFKEINEHCDRVNIMAYDQQRADLSLNGERKGAPYIPVADAAWVEKVMKLTEKSIDKRKLSLGVATYGAEWELQVAPEWYREYSKLWALNPEYADDTLDDLDIKPVRNAAGELSFTYLPEGTTIPKSYKAPKGTPEGYEAAARALAFANATGKTVLVNVVWWSDAKAIEDKVALVKSRGWKGVSIFKIDGGADQNLWSLF